MPMRALKSVEGPNPIIVSSQGQRRKICSNEKVFIKDGDIVELIPSTHLFKYMAFGSDISFQTPQKSISSSKREKRHSEERESLVAKRNKQILEDEALARDLQQVEDDSILECSSEKKEALHNFRVSEEGISDTFRLMRVQDLPSWANSYSVTIRDVIQGGVLVAILSNYMVDIDWLLSACPTLKNIPHVIVAHGESGVSFDHLSGCTVINHLSLETVKNIVHTPQTKSRLLLVNIFCKDVQAAPPYCFLYY